MNYKNYSLYDFLKDKFFVDWVKNPTMESELFWKSWQEDNPEKKTEIEKAKKLLLSIQYSQANLSQAELNDSLEQVLRRMEEFDLEEDPVEIPKFKTLKWAASIALFVMASVFTYFLFNLQLEQQEISELPFVIKETSSGIKSTIKLSDGTVVILNSNSQLKTPEKFPKNLREVYLEGEAYFQVRKDTLRPFIIHTADMKVKVLGTSFNVRSFSDEDQIQVALVEGKVEASNNTVNNGSSYSIVLTPNEMLTYNRSVKKLNKETFDLEEIVGWKDDKIVFNKASFDEVVKKLESWYGVKFVLEGRPKNQKGFSGTFQGKSLQEVLQGISFSSGFKFSIQDKVVIIKNE